MNITLAQAGTVAQLRTFSLSALTGALTKEITSQESKAKRFAKYLIVIDEKREMGGGSLSAYVKKAAGYKDTNALALHKVLAEMVQEDAWGDTGTGPADKIGEHHFDKASVLALKAASQCLTLIEKKFPYHDLADRPLREQLALALRTGGEGCTKAIETIKAGVTPEKAAKAPKGTEAPEMTALREENERLKASLVPLTPDRILGLLTRDTFFAPMAEAILKDGDTRLAALANAQKGFDALCALATQSMKSAHPATNAAEETTLAIAS